MSLSAQAPQIQGLGGEYGEIIEELGPWFHNIHLPNGEQTAPHHPLGDFPANKWAQIAPHVPDNLSGATVLDIGCNAGYYSLALARRGAQVFAVDHDQHYLSQAAWVAAECGLAHRITLRRSNVYGLRRGRDGLPHMFDIVLFMGVLYHLRYPLLGLDLAAERCKRLFVFQTLQTADAETAKTPDDLSLHDRQRLDEPGWPRMAFIERCLASDPTNWWAPNAACVEAMLRSAGMAVFERPGHELYLCRPTEAEPVGRRRGDSGDLTDGI